MGISVCFDQSNDIVSNQADTPVFPCLPSPSLSSFFPPISYFSVLDKVSINSALTFSSWAFIQHVSIHSKRQCRRTWNVFSSEYISNLVIHGFGLLMWRTLLNRVCYHDHSPMLPRSVQSNLINAGRAFSVWEVFASPKPRGGICPGHNSRYLFPQISSDDFVRAQYLYWLSALHGGDGGVWKGLGGTDGHVNV